MALESEPAPRFVDRHVRCKLQAPTDEQAAML
jgi:hypothetical protein